MCNWFACKIRQLGYDPYRLIMGAYVKKSRNILENCSWYMCIRINISVNVILNGFCFKFVYVLLIWRVTNVHIRFSSDYARNDSFDFFLYLVTRDFSKEKSQKYIWIWTYSVVYVYNLIFTYELFVDLSFFIIWMSATGVYFLVDWSFVLFKMLPC